jgi:RNA polymerase primary sigma factor
MGKKLVKQKNQTIGRYLQEISKIELITPVEEIELAQRINKGDQEALERLIKANLRFVVSIAKQYQNQGLALIDLISEGNLGLFKAAQRFDPSKGFNSYLMLSGGSGNL